MATNFNLDDPNTNLRTIIKFRADLSGAETISVFPGEIWAMVPNEGNYRLFKTFGIGATHAEEVDEGWRLYSKEILYYCDPDSGEILSEWDNPFIGRKVEVAHIKNDPTNGVFLRGGQTPISAPFPYAAYDDHIVFQLNFYPFRKSPLPRKDYPLYSPSDYSQHAELWGIQGLKSEAMDPDISSAASTTSWSRVDQWQPWMEMGNSPGNMVFHSHSFKLKGGVQDLPRQFLEHTEKHHPQYLESPQVWEQKFTDLLDVFKELVDSGKRR